MANPPQPTPGEQILGDAQPCRQSGSICVVTSSVPAIVGSPRLVRQERQPGGQPAADVTVGGGPAVSSRRTAWSASCAVMMRSASSGGTME
jgi:hypothetical protein